MFIMVLHSFLAQLLQHGGVEVIPVKAISPKFSTFIHRPGLFSTGKSPNFAGILPQAIALVRALGKYAN